MGLLAKTAKTLNYPGRFRSGRRTYLGQRLSRRKGKEGKGRVSSCGIDPVFEENCCYYSLILVFGIFAQKIKVD